MPLVVPMPRDHWEQGQWTVGLIAQLKKPANTDRWGIAIFNLGSVPIYLGKDSAVQVANGFPVLPNTGIYLDGYTGDIWTISGTALQDVRYLVV